MIDLVLISTGGDMHTGGLCDEPTIIEIDCKNKRSVDTFLKYQNLFHISAYDKSFPNKTNNKLYKKFLKSFLKLQQLGIFSSKWDFRTSWEYQKY